MKEKYMKFFQKQREIELEKKEFGKIIIALNKNCYVFSDEGMCNSRKVTSHFLNSICGNLLNEELSSLMKEFCDVKCLKQIKSAFLENLHNDLFEISQEILRFEIQLAFDKKIFNAQSKEEILDSIRHLFRDINYIEYIISKYPIYAFKIYTRIENISKSFSLFLRRFRSDKSIIEKIFSLKDALSEIVSIKCAESDSHLDASRVIILAFTNGKKIVYKPRPVDGEKIFSEILFWLNKRICTDFFIPCVINRLSYGWMEFIEQKPVMSIDAITLYFKRYGQLAALVQTLGSSDIHFENLVCHGAHPVIIDMETLFQNTQIFNENTNFPINSDPGNDFQSPFYSGMIDKADYFSARNFSPLSQPVDRKKIWIDIELEKNSLQHVFSAQKKYESHSLLYKDNIIHYDDYVDNICIGYEGFFDTILPIRQELLLLIKKNFSAETKFRLVLRPTSEYTTILNALHSPFALESLKNSDTILFHLLDILSARENFSPFISSECQALWNGDIPYFLCYGATRHVWTPNFSQIENIMTSSQLSSFERKIDKFSPKSIQESVSILRFGLSAKISIRKKIPINEKNNSWNLNVEHPKYLISTLLESIQLEKNRVFFCDNIVEKNNLICMNVVNSNIYCGLGGIFFSALYGLDKNSKNIFMMRNKLDIFLHMLSRNENSNIGICAGVGGNIWLAAHIAQNEGNSNALDFAVRESRKAVYRLPETTELDIFNGISGLLLSLCSTFTVSKDSTFLDLLHQTSLHLCKLVSYQYNEAMIISDFDYIKFGFAHGLSGVGTALLRTYPLTGSRRVLSTIEFIARCLNTCIEKFIHAAEQPNSTSLSRSWCQGTSGLMNFFIEAERNNFKLHNHNETIERLAKTVKNQMKEKNASLCHGLFGMIDPLIDMESKADLQKFFKQYKGTEYKTGIPKYAPNHSLFNGYSGIAYQFLRFDCPQKFPSILRFDPPLSQE